MMENKKVTKDDISKLSAYAEDHGFCTWMNADPTAKASLALGLMLRRIPLLADNPSEALVLPYRTVSGPMGVGGCFMEAPRALPVGLHLLDLFVGVFLAQLQSLNKMSANGYEFYIRVSA
jgi:hypothetical protein